MINTPDTAAEITALPDPVLLSADVLPVINFALQLNRVPVIRSITITNQMDKPLEGVDICISAAPEFCLPFSRRIEYIPASSAFELKDISVTLDAEYLASLTEKAPGLLRLSLRLGEDELCHTEIETTTLAFNEWHGYSFYPELLAAFVTPNHPEVTRINARAAELLGSWTGDPSLDAYQTQDPNRVLTQAAAVFGAIQEQNIVYAVAPASFEPAGQRVRLCDSVIQQKMGNCLDLTLMYASCLEAIGLKPLLVIKKGHIFAGVWLDNLTFPEAVQDDVSLLTKRMAEGISEIAVVECTSMTAGRSSSFDDAQASARRQLSDAAAFEYVIDISRARLSGVSPLPMRVQTGDGWHIEREERTEKELTDAPEGVSGAVEVDELKQEAPLTRRAQWERRLLDLGLRNALINLRLSKTLIPLLSSSLDELENALAGGSDFSILPRPADWQIKAEEITLEGLALTGGQTELITSEFKNKRLRSLLGETELTRAIKELYRSSKTAMEENGANTLYLALGLLRWYENARSSKARYAPLVLLPIEIIRKSASQGYIIRLRDDEPQMNITLLEKLKQDFRLTVGGLETLPQDEHGVDLRKVFTILRKAIMGQSRWDILETASLGIFSFSQFVMWNDLHNRSGELARSKVVKSLMDGKLAWAAEDMTIGEKVDENGVFLPLPADASQLFAIRSAAQGETFVLHGPPGTGKSQTITAMIANALAQGKTVLFVAEKMAALEVVQRRLDKIGVGAFCLELHSNKSKKRDVLDQLRIASEVTRTRSAEEYAARADQIAVLRAKLDHYAEALHAPLSCGKSAYQLISGYETHISAPDIGAFPESFAPAMTAARWDDQISTAERLTAAGRAVGHPAGHPLSPVGCVQYSQRLKNSLAAQTAAYLDSLAALEKAASAMCTELSLSPAVQMDDYSKLSEIAENLMLWTHLPRAWAQTDAPNQYFLAIEDMARKYMNVNSLRTTLTAVWKDDFLAQDGAALKKELNENSGKWFLMKAIGMNGIVRRLTPYAKGAVPKNDLELHLDGLCAYQREKAAADQLFKTYGAGLDMFYAGASTNWNDIITAAQNARSSVQELAALPEGECLRQRLSASRASAELLSGMIQAWTACAESGKALYDALSIRLEHPDGSWIDQQKALCETLAANADKLREWILFNSICEEACALGLEPLVAAYKNGLEHDAVVPALHKALYRTLAMHAIDESPALNTFSGALFNEQIEQFRRMDEQLTELTRQEIYCRLAARVPNFAREAAQSSELGILQRAIRSGGRGVSIRKLFDQLPNLLPRLCPCMLMSPISAAQYLDPNREPFDVVVFDEASQLSTCKAVGVLARGRDAIIVGDPKQMPPTSFFASNRLDEENLDVEDLESILDDCLALSMPQTHLLWHYRSRHESLIAYSNSRFYENRLYTFPSVNDRESKVTLVHVDGVFDRGKTRQNHAEAEAVVEELKRRCHDPELSKMSVGVVTFNISQQNLIDDLLTEACQTDPALDAWAYNSPEPVFIKNLENVQGDERDVILFSVGYGPDASGKVSMNFGPLNRDGGWRRLNVAISRARCEMIVFATITPDQISLERTSAEGVAALKGFLEYAGGRGLAQDENTSRQIRQRNEGIAEAICRALGEQGFETDRSVGHSEYRIDIGVINPQHPEKYLLGILLDGGSYASSKTTRDRETAQIGVLNGLGWRITRVWSMDWWDNSRRELDRLIAEIKASIEAEEQAQREREEAALRAREEAQTAKESLSLSNPSEPAETAAEEPVASSALEEAEITQTVSPAWQPPVYTPAELPQDDKTSEEFLTPRYGISIRARVKRILEQEAPVSEDLMTRRIVQSAGIARTGSRIQTHLAGMYQDMRIRATEQNGERFFWRDDQDPAAYALFRIADSETNRRDAKDLPTEEAANAMEHVLFEQFSLSEADLIRETARLMGYGRPGSALTAVMKRALLLAKEAGRIGEGANGSLVLTDEGRLRAEKRAVAPASENS